MTSKISAIITAWRHRGIKWMLASVPSYLSDFVFDKRYGTDTFSWTKLEDLDIASENKQSGNDYHPTQALPFKRLLKKLMIPEGKVFIDLGCGKGRTLLIASGYGFREVRGVEFSGELCRIAEKNSKVYKQKTGVAADFRIVESDVVQYTILDEDVFYMFNPFADDIMEQVIQNIVDSLAKQKRKIWIIYRNPEHNRIIEEREEFSKLLDYNCLGSVFSVYTNRDLSSPGKNSSS